MANRLGRIDESDFREYIDSMMSDMSTRGQQSKASKRTKETIELIKALYQTIPADSQQELLKVLTNGFRKKNQRKHARKSSLIPVAYAVQGRAFMDYMRNVGGGGVFIESSVPVSVGQEISLILSFPKYLTSFKTIGEVVRIDPRGFGVRFKNVAKYQEEMIQCLVEKLDDV